MHVQVAGGAGLGLCISRLLLEEAAAAAALMEAEPMGVWPPSAASWTCAQEAEQAGEDSWTLPHMAPEGTSSHFLVHVLSQVADDKCRS